MYRIYMIPVSRLHEIDSRLHDLISNLNTKFYAMYPHFQAKFFPFLDYDYKKSFIFEIIFIDSRSYAVVSRLHENNLESILKWFRDYMKLI